MKHILFKKKNKRNGGSTLVELIVCFALLGIFMSAATVIISNVTMLYYSVKGETYAQQVSDIVIKKIAGELEGARVYADNPVSYPVIYRPDGSTDRAGNKMEVYNRTDTLVQIYAEDGLLKLRYLPINPDLPKDEEDEKTKRYEETIWTFDEKMYQGFLVKELRFVPADRTSIDDTDSTEEKEYPVNVVAVYLTLESPKYGEFNTYRYIRMYNLKDETSDGRQLAWNWEAGSIEGTLAVKETE